MKGALANAVVACCLVLPASRAAAQVPAPARDVSGMGYGAFLEQNVFRPAGLTATAHDSSAASLVPDRASGYVPVGATGLANAPYIDWTTKTGNGSLYSTAQDQC